jgi:hypothetical protein
MIEAMPTETYTATYLGYTVSITLRDEWWSVDPIGTPQVGTEKEMISDSLLESAARFDVPFTSREQAEAVAKQQLKTLMCRLHLVGPENQYLLTDTG